MSAVDNVNIHCTRRCAEREYSFHEVFCRDRFYPFFESLHRERVYALFESLRRERVYPFFKALRRYERLVQWIFTLSTADTKCLRELPWETQWIFGLDFCEVTRHGDGICTYTNRQYWFGGRGLLVTVTCNCTCWWFRFSGWFRYLYILDVLTRVEHLVCWRTQAERSQTSETAYESILYLFPEVMNRRDVLPLYLYSHQVRNNLKIGRMDLIFAFLVLLIFAWIQTDQHLHCIARSSSATNIDRFLNSDSNFRRPR